jgi:hypothetical protein
MCSMNACRDFCRDGMCCCARINTNKQKENNTDNVNPKIVITQPTVNIIYKNSLK